MLQLNIIKLEEHNFELKIKVCKKKCEKHRK